jgi:hypothetical protein
MVMSTLNQEQDFESKRQQPKKKMLISLQLQTKETLLNLNESCHVPKA